MTNSPIPRRFAPVSALLGGAAALLLLALPARDLRAQDTAIVVNPTRPLPSAPLPPTGRPAEVLVGTGPNGATLRCRDGSYPEANAPETACATKGGVLVRFPVKRTPANGPSLRRTTPHSLPGDTVAAPALRLEPVPDRSNVLVPAPLPPANATLQCGDGTFVVSDTSSVRCTGKGGVAVVFPPRRRGN